MDTLEERRGNVDWNWYKETQEEIHALSGYDRFGNYWSCQPQYDHYFELYQPKMVGQVGLNDGSWWNLNAITPDQAIDILIKDGKYNPPS